MAAEWGRAMPLVAALVLALVGVACGAERAPAPRQDVGPVRGGTFVMALSADPGHLNPAITTMGVTHEASELLYNGLVGMDQNLSPVPELAAAWSVEQEGAVYRFTLADGVKWHDGAPLSSRDVKFTFEEVLLKFHGRTRASLRPNLDAIDTPDERTVVFRFKQPSRHCSTSSTSRKHLSFPVTSTPAAIPRRTPPTFARPGPAPSSSPPLTRAST